jgi:hypothetical protein
MSSTALANGALFVDNYTPSIGHSSCAGVGTRWVEPIINPQTSAPLHPNTTGQQMAFAHLKAAIDASGAGLPNDPATSDPAAGITSLALSKRSFRAAAGKQSRIAGIGAVLRLKLKAAGSVTITYSRKLPGVKRNGVCRATRSRSVSSTKRCTALRRVAGHLHLSGHSGVNVVRLSGRMKGRALAPGNYRLQVAVKWTSRSTSSSDSISFRILPN